MDNSGWVPQKTYPAGTIIIPYTTGRSQNGTNKHVDFLRIKGLYDKGQNTIGDNVYGIFIGCRIRNDSDNTPVYGNWN